MTHFRTYCIDKYDGEELYNKFSEHIEVPEYVSGKVEEKSIVSFMCYYSHHMHEYPNLPKNLKRKLNAIKELLEKDYGVDSFGLTVEGFVTDENKKKEAYMKMLNEFETLYDFFGDDWNGNRYRKNEQGVWVEYSTYNPNTVFDYYSQEDVTTLGELKNPVDTLCDACGVFKNNEYYSFEEVGWFGYSNPIVDEKSKEEIVKNLIEGLPSDTPIYRFDCHI